MGGWLQSAGTIATVFVGALLVIWAAIALARRGHQSATRWRTSRVLLSAATDVSAHSAGAPAHAAQTTQSLSKSLQPDTAFKHPIVQIEISIAPEGPIRELSCKRGPPPDLTIEYVDRHGIVTWRQVSVLEFLPNYFGGGLRCWCHLRQEERTFRVTSILTCLDPEGRPVDINEFIERRYPEATRHFAIYKSERLEKVLQQLHDGCDLPATERQVRALATLGLGLRATNLTRGQAHALISAWRYGEAVLLRLVGSMDDYEQEREIEAELTLFIVLDDALRNRALKWSERRFARGTTYATPSPRRDEHFERVAAKAQELLAAHGTKFRR